MLDFPLWEYRFASFKKKLLIKRIFTPRVGNPGNVLLTCRNPPIFSYHWVIVKIAYKTSKPSISHHDSHTNSSRIFGCIIHCKWLSYFFIRALLIKDKITIDFYFYLCIKKTKWEGWYLKDLNNNKYFSRLFLKKLNNKKASSYSKKQRPKQFLFKLLVW